MKNIVQIIIAIVITIVGMFCIYEVLNKKEEDKKITYSEKFKNEYESFNNKTNSNGIKYPDVTIPNNNNMVYSTEEEVVDIIKNGTGVIYFGYPECPWCRNAVPVLIDAANETSLDKIYYLNAKDIRDTKILDADGNIVTKKKGTKGYYEIVESLDKYLDSYDGLEDESIKRLYVPTVVFIKDGVVVAIHVDTVESQEDPYTPLNDEQKKELKEIYLSGIHKVLGDLCDESC